MEFPLCSCVDVRFRALWISQIDYVLVLRVLFHRVGEVKLALRRPTFMYPRNEQPDELAKIGEREQPMRSCQNR